MVMCKFFLQGTCRFGDNCKFEHQYNDRNYAGNSSILLHNYASKPQVTPQATSNVDTNTLVKAVVNDMTSAEKGGQWLLSSYAPFKEKPAFPGFEDHSMEEIRYLFYECVKTGNIEQYKQNLQSMLQHAMMKVKALQNPSLEAVNMLKTIYDTPTSNSVSTNQSPFGTPAATSNSPFGGSQSVFGNTNQSVFGGGNNTGQQGLFNSNTKSVFGPQQSGTVFGQQNKSIFGQTQPTSGSIFGGGSGASVFPGATQSSLFGQPPQNASPFAQGQPAPNASPFGQGQPTQSTSPFAQTQPVLSTSPFAQTQPAQSTSPFAQTQPAQSTSPFAQTQPAQNASPFAQGQPPQNVSPFAQAPPAQTQTAGPFGQQAPFSQQNVFQQPTSPPNQFVANSSPFGGTNTPFAPQQSNFTAPPNPQSGKPSFLHTQSIFGNVGLQSNAFGNASQNKPNPEFYSKLEDLTEEEIKWFQSDDLDIAKIPEKPPAYEMCFKVQ